jgi:hypothetical protein
MRTSIRQRIYLGFSLVILLTIAVGGYSVYQQGVVNEQYLVRGRLEEIARLVLTEDGLASRLIGLGEGYRLAPTPERIADLEQTRREIEEIGDKLIGLSFSAEQRKIYVEIRDNARAVKPEETRLAAAGAALAQARERLFTGGDELTSATNTLVGDVRARGGEALLGRAQTVEGAVLLVRVANWRFLATFDSNGPATFARNVEKAEAAL